MLEFISVLFVFLGLVGAYVNARGSLLLSYKIWIISNAFFVWYNVEINSISQILSNLAYFVLSIIGYWKYRKDDVYK